MSDAPEWLSELADGSLDDVNDVTGETLVLTTGRIVACDPLVFLSSADPFAREVKPGKYDVRIGKQHLDTAYAYIKFGRGKIAKWEVAHCPGEEDAEGWPGYGVDSGTGCFVDLELVEKFNDGERALSERVAARMIEEEVDVADVLAYHAAFEKFRAELGGDDPLATIEPLLRNSKPAAAIRLSPKSDANLVAFSTGAGDGVYASFWGLDAKGKVQALVTDFGLLEDDDDESDDDESDDDESDDDESDDDESDDDGFDDSELANLGDLEALAAALGAQIEPQTETMQEPSPFFVQTRDLLKRWIDEEKLELEPDVNIDTFAEHLLEKLVSLSGKKFPGSHLAEWLLDRREVADVFASDADFENDLGAR